MALIGCAGSRPDDLSAPGDRLVPCPSSPNCVSSDAADTVHAVDPLVLLVPAPEGWRAARDAVAGMPRTRIVVERGDSLHAECRSAIFRFVDDLELQLRRDEGVIAVRSASRLGYGDMGVNRRRVESLRAILARQGIARPAPAP